MFLQYAGHKFGLTDFAKKKKKNLRSSSVRAVWDKLALEASGTSEMQPQAAAKEPRAAQGTIAICGKG